LELSIKVSKHREMIRMIPNEFAKNIILAKTSKNKSRFYEK